MSHAIREAIAGILRAPVLTGLSAAMVGLALFVVSLFALAAFNLRVALQEVEARVEVVAYLREGTTPGEMEIARTELTALPEVLEVAYVSKGEALQRARRDLPGFGELFVSAEVNPLPASIEVRLRDGSRTKTSVEEIANIAYFYPFVEDVQYGREWVDKLFTLRRMAAFTTAVLGGAFGAVAALIIGTRASDRHLCPARRDLHNAAGGSAQSLHQAAVRRGGGHSRLSRWRSRSRPYVGHVPSRRAFSLPGQLDPRKLGGGGGGCGRLVRHPVERRRSPSSLA